MAQPRAEEMEDYLRCTELCDSDSSEVSRKASEIAGSASTFKERAVGIFYFVRDEIPFALDNFEVKASQTLKKGKGHCVNKVNLQVALLRAAGIPARYHQGVLVKDCLKGIVADFIFRATPDRIWYHPWCECHLSGEWISCDAIFDRPLYEGILARDIARKDKIPTIDWDGESNLNVMSAWMVEDLGTFDSFDAVLKKGQKDEFPPQIVVRVIFSLSNWHTDRIRKR